MVDGTWPLKTATLCLPCLLSISVKPRQAASWSTEGSRLTVTNILLADFSRSASCCFALSMVIICVFVYRFFVWAYACFQPTIKAYACPLVSEGLAGRAGGRRDIPGSNSFTTSTYICYSHCLTQY